jgi:hypothetical protein
MSKKDNHKQDLSRLFYLFFETGDAAELQDYIVSNSNLPGRRGNLELAAALAELVADYAGSEAGRLWPLCLELSSISAAEAPVNDPRELLPFCGAVGLGAIGSTCPDYFAPAVSRLKTLANDPRWRMREAVAMGLQRLLAQRKADVFQALAGWIAAGSLLELRAAAAAVAEPPLLTGQEEARLALELHRQIIERGLATKTRKSEAFRVWRKALGYTLSVVVRAVPGEGFEFMAHLVKTQDPDGRWIVKENLKKSRLTRNFPERVASLKQLLQ